MKTFQFKIQLANISKPPVWRRVQVPASFTFYDLHRVIQIAFLWDDIHLYQFTPQGYGSYPVIALKNEFDSEKPDYYADKTKLYKIFSYEGQKYVYIYDFGDDWIHKITLEKILDTDKTYPVCLAGKGQGPPEDCGGPWGYENLKEILSDPSHEQYEEMREWVGLKKNEVFDPKKFNIEEINIYLKSVFNK